MIRITRVSMFVLAVVTAGIAFVQPAVADEPKFPTIVNVEVQAAGADRFDFSVTISSPYDGPERHADGFRIMNADGLVFGELAFPFDPANGDPFKRVLRGVSIPSDVRTVSIQGRDVQNGYGGRTRPVMLPK